MGFGHDLLYIVIGLIPGLVLRVLTCSYVDEKIFKEKSTN